MKMFLGLLCVAIGLVSGLYLFFWWGLVQPIINVCQMIDTHTISAMSIAGEVFKFFVRDIVAVVVGGFFFLVGAALIKD